MRTFVVKMIRRLCGLVRKYCIPFVAGFGFAVVCFLAVNAASHHFSSPEYCGGKCHEMKSAYRSWELSRHYANSSGVVAECVDCHLPGQDRYFTHLTVKAYVGLKDIYQHHFGGAYDANNMQKKVLEDMPSDRCLSCHSNLLGRPGSSAARLAHQAVLNPAAEPEQRCVECHHNLHERERKVFAPE